MKNILHSVLFSALLLCGLNLTAQDSTPEVRVDRGENFELIKIYDEYLYPLDISSNKRHVVLQGFAATGNYYWSEEIGTLSIKGLAYGVADDGSVAGSYTNNLGINLAGLWSPTSKEWEFLGMNPDVPELPSEEGETDYNGAWAINSSGKVAVMQFINGYNTSTYTWTKEDGYTVLSNGDSPQTRPNAISDDGRIIAGLAAHKDKGEWTPCYWVDGEIKRFPYLFGEALNVSHNGNYVCGYLLDNTAFVYDIANESFDVIEGETSFQVKATCVSNNGIVFGYIDGGSPQDRSAIAYIGGELISFNDYLVDLGIEEASEWSIYSINDITADGKTFIGAATIDGEDCSFILNVDGISCAAPTNLTYTIENINNIVLKWDAPENADNVTYEIYTGYSIAPFVNGITETSFVFDNIDAGEYTFFVRANYGDECLSEISNVVKPVVYPCAEDNKCGITFIKFDNGTYEEDGEYFFGDGWDRGYISIKGSKSDIEYKIQLDTKGDINDPVIETIELCPDVYTFTWVKGVWDSEVGFTIRFKGEDIYNLQFGDITDDFKTTFLEYEIDCSLNVDEMTSQDMVSIMPNPAKNYFHIEGVDMINVEVFNAIGQKTDNINVNDNNVKINTDDYKEGIYFVKINTSDANVIVKKIIVTK